MNQCKAKSYHLAVNSRYHELNITIRIILPLILYSLLKLTLRTQSHDVIPRHLQFIPMPPIPPILRNHSLSPVLPSLPSPKTPETTSPEPNLDHETALIKALSPSSATYITLTISLPRTTYATVVLLGDSFPSTFLTPDPSPSPSLIVSPPAVQRKQRAAGEVSDSPNVGIVIGCVAGLGLLLGVVYVWILRARQSRRRRKGKKTKKKKVEKTEKPKAKKSVKKKRRRMRRMRRKRRGSVKVCIVL